MTPQRRRLPLLRPVSLLRLVLWPLTMFAFGLIAMSLYLLQLGGWL